MGAVARAGSWSATLWVVAWSFACSKPAATTEGPAVETSAAQAPKNAAEPRPPRAEDEPGVVREGCPEGMVRIDGNETLAPFCMGETEVSVAEFRRCVAAGKCRDFDLKWDFRGDPQKATWILGDDSMPINFVDEEQARQYCAYLGGRLPTADEWMWALGSAQGWAFPWGNEFSYEKDWYCGCWRRPGQHLASAALCPARQYPDDRTLQGVYDMAGSADEIIGPNESGEYGILLGVAPSGIPTSDMPKAAQWTETNKPKPWYAGLLVTWRDTTSIRCIALPTEPTL